MSQSLSNNRPFDIVFFDCDSTLSKVEGIDELAIRAGVAEELVPLTNAAMEGSIPLQDIYRKRLELIRPDQEALNWLSQRYVDQMVEGATEVVSELIKQDRSIHIVSGGLRQAVLSVGKLLNIPEDQVHAVDIFFDERGNYAGFDEQSPLARAGGKAEVCRKVLDQTQGNNNAALVGDGMTDLEAAAAGVYVIGFGGVARREAVVQGASAYVDDPALTLVLSLLLANGALCS